MLFLEVLVVLCLSLIAYTWVGYPVSLWLSDSIREGVRAVRFLERGRERRRAPLASLLPKVSLVFAAHDEEACVQEKIENALDLDWPASRLEVLVACDGCSDRTAAVAREAGGERVRVFEYARRGKAASVSALVGEARGDIVVMTDANVLLDRNALRALVRAFEDPLVGAAVGRLALFDPAEASAREGAYWLYESLLKWLEGRHGCVLGANGGIYAVRRGLFTALPADTIVDDFVIPLRIALKGWRVPYVPDAVGREETPGDTAAEFGRRTRIGAGDWQALSRLPAVVDPRSGFLAFAFISHKLLRWISPALLALSLLACAVLAVARGGVFEVLFLLQLGFYLLAALGDAAPPILRRMARLARHFVAMHAALAVGFWRFTRGAQRPAWDRTPRPGESPAMAMVPKGASYRDDNSASSR